MEQQDLSLGTAGAAVKPKRPSKSSFNKRVTRLVKVEMVKRDMGFKELARLLEQANPGSGHTAESLTTRINRGTFTAAFLVEMADALKMRVVLVPNQ